MVLKTRVQAVAPPGCPMSMCMALLGGRWTPELLWSLSNGARRFSELSRHNPLISAKVLTSRLRELERRGVVDRNVIASSPPTVEYELTMLGQDLLPAIRSIVEVGSRLLLRDREAHPSATLQSGEVRSSERARSGNGRRVPDKRADGT